MIMGRKRSAGFFLKRGVWQMDKQIFGRRIRESTGTRNLNEAEIVLARKINALKDEMIYGVKPKHLFQEAKERYLKEKAHKASIGEDIHDLGYLRCYFNNQPLEAIHMGSLQAFIEQRKKDGVKNRTINKALQILRHLLNLAASEWLNDDGKPWLDHAPKLRMLSESDKKEPYPLSWEEQDRLFAKLPLHLRCMALFKVNTGCRMHEVCALRWEWECKIPEINTSVFLIPRHSIENGKIQRHVKNSEHRLVVLNNTAKQIIEEIRG